MKKVIKDDELYSIITDAVNILCDSVSSTLGPCGNNVLINNDERSPFITNDGVTIASSIEDDDIRINSVLEIVKEASIKTNIEVGDGTTTTLVLLQSIIKDGFDEIKKGKNAYILKNELSNTLNNILKRINDERMNSSKEQLLNIAITSSNDIEIGNIVFKVFSKMKNKYSIKILESNDNNTYYKIKKGYSIDLDNVNNLYFEKKDKIDLKDVYVLTIRGYLESLEQISDIINEAFLENKNLIIFSSEYDNNVNEQIILYNLEQKKNIYLFKTPDYGSRKTIIEEDISLLCGSSIKNINYENVSWKDIGFIENVSINKNNIILINKNKEINNKINSLKNKIKQNITDYEKEFIENRISSLSNGIAYIYVGGYTKTEIKEKIMRYEDAINALDCAKNGILYGEGITYLKVSESLNDKITSEKILKNALQKPFQKIFENAGIDYIDIKNIIIDSKYKKIYNFDKNIIENIKLTKIIDPFNVEIVALKNAVSIASMILTTNYLVINENKNIKTNEF